MKIFVLMVFSLTGIVLKAQPGDRYSRSASFMDFKDSKTKLFGFKNEKGKVVVPAIYSQVYFETTWGKWTVTKDSMIGLYNFDGKLILPPVYKFIESHHDMNNEFIIVSNDNRKFGLTDLKGNKLLDLKYPRILDFCKNLLLVWECNNDSIFNKSIIDTLQNVILDENVLHADIYGFVEEYPYDSNNVLYLQVKKNEKFALFASTGRQISDFVFFGLLEAKDGLVKVRLSYTGGNCGVIDQNNKIIIPFKYSSLGILDNGTIAASTEDGITYYFDSNGNEISEEVFKSKQNKNPNWKTD